MAHIGKYGTEGQNCMYNFELYQILSKLLYVSIFKHDSLIPS